MRQSSNDEPAPWSLSYLDGSRPWRNLELLPPVEDANVRGYGYLPSGSGRSVFGPITEISDRAALRGILAKNHKVRWIAVPGSSYLIPSDLLDPRHSTVELGRYRWAVRAAMRRPLRLLALGLLLFFIFKSPVFLVLTLVFSFFPLLDLALDLLRRPDRMSVAQLNEERVDETFFLLWTRQIGRPWIGLCIGVLVLVYVLQVSTGFGRSLDVAALIKIRVWMGEWWRLVTVAFLHGHPLHLFFNAFALFHLARVSAALAPMRLLMPLFLFSLLTGSMASLWLMPHQDSVGASGGILGLLGFLAVYGLRFRGFLPRGIRSGILRSAGAMVILGIMGAGFIDNAAHAGGFAGGALFAALFYRRRQPQNNSMSLTGETICRLSAVVLAGAGLFVIGRLLGLLPT